MQTSWFNRHFGLVRIAFPLKAIHYNQTPRYSVKRTGSQSVPLVPGLYKTHWIMRTLTCLPCKFVCYRWLIQHYNSIGTHSTSRWSAFITSVRQGRALRSTQQCSMGTYCHAYRKYTGSLRNTDTSIIRTCSGGLMVSAAEGFHCTLHFQSTYHKVSLHAYTHCKLKWEESY